MRFDSIDGLKKGRNSKWVMLQSWKNILFLHWPVSPEWISPHLPRGLELDTYKGDAWISIVSFKVPTTRFRYLPKIPYIPSMLQVNVRTYVKRGGEKGIFFFTVDTNKISAIIGAKFATLPYYRAKMILKEKTGNYYMYSSRSGKSNAKWKVTYGPSGKTFLPDTTSIDYWLLERYILWSFRYKKLFRADIKHEEWKVKRAKFQIEVNTLLSFLPSGKVEDKPLAHYAESKVSLNWIPIKI